MEKVLAIIPARGGSKAVPRKNIRLVGEKPLIAYTIEAAKESHLITRSVVSTEDGEISKISSDLGCEVLIRPLELATDETPTLPVIQHVFTYYEKQGEFFNFGVLLQPTSPFRTGKDIDEAISILCQSGADSVISVVQVSDHHPSRMYRLVDGCLVSYENEPVSRRRQDLPPVYHRNGAIYAFKRALIDQGTIFGETIYPYIMPEARSVNIDNENDLLLADLIMRKMGR